MVGGCLAAAAATSASQPAGAVIVSGSNGTGTANVLPNSTPPVAGWANAGTILSGSGVYLGNQWVLTVSHIAPNATIGSGTPFTLTSGAVLTTDQTSVRLVNPSDNSPTDLLLLHVSTDPALQRVNLSSATPTLGTTIYSMGNGLTRSSSLQYFNTSTNPWTVVAGPTATSGYTESSPRVYRWGSNVTAAFPGTAAATGQTSVGSGTVTAFASDFDSNGTTSEMQVSTGDSGGPVFNAANVLVGLNVTAYNFNGQPTDTAVFGDASAYVDLSVYRNQIVSVTGVPEPSTLVAGAAAAAGLLLRRRRRA
ncbi:MAG TPA: trypsin-like serine protease [Humisphaera sp.]